MRRKPILSDGNIVNRLRQKRNIVTVTPFDFGDKKANEE